MRKRCYIVGAGEFCEDELPIEGDYIIAADAGYTSLTERGFIPNLVIGDFDSLKQKPDHPNVIQVSPIKDDTDMMLAVKAALNLGYQDFVINGGLDGRFDQAIANIQILVFLTEHNAIGTLIGEKKFVTAVKDGTIGLKPLSEDSAKSIISIFSYSEKAIGVTLKGLKYPLENTTLSNSFPIGVSNEFSEEKAEITVEDGVLLIVIEEG
ncbi:MAG: thiamine diphosphokinase [Oscillospiraceae bacterium]|jgi:thiamine pyrophosphokinase|nr:thiamine diphosphokinase [Oscillospiraceae bacterium]